MNIHFAKMAPYGFQDSDVDCQVLVQEYDSADLLVYLYMQVL